MRVRHMIFTALLLTGLTLTGCRKQDAMSVAESSGWHHYGLDVAVNKETKEVALADLKAGMDNIIVKGEINGVCEKKGCWMTLGDGKDKVLVRFQNYSFFVPRNSNGHKVVALGRTEEQEIPVEQLRHRAEEQGKSEEEIAAITEPQKYLIFYARSVYIEGDDLDEPYSPGDELDMKDHEHKEAGEAAEETTGEHEEGAAHEEAGETEENEKESGGDEG